MITLVSKQIEDYAITHTSPLPTYLKSLMDFTQETRDDSMMLTGIIEGGLLQFLVWTANAQRILEVGTFTGFSAQIMAEALPDNGQLITCDIDLETSSIAKEYWDKSPHGHKIQLRVGPALKTLTTLDGMFDLIFIDADKENYPEYFENALKLLAPRGIIVIDNVLWGGNVLVPQNPIDRAIASLNTRISEDPELTHVLLPVRDGIMLVHRI